MNLFLAAGMDIPSNGDSPRSQKAGLKRLSLFSHDTIDRAFKLRAIAPTQTQLQLAQKYAERARAAAISAPNEHQFRQIFYQEVLTGLLGYTPYSDTGEFSLSYEYRLRRKPVDVALGRFVAGGEGDQVVAPFELKGPNTADLDKIMPGRGISPVQQAWDYAADAPGARWVLVSNCLEIRLYRFGRGRDTYELFDLKRIDQEEELKRLLLVLEARRLLGADTETLLIESDSALKEITDELYTQYSQLRSKLVGFLKNESEGPKLGHFEAIQTAQKLLDRVIFIAFASGNNMLPGTIFQRAVNTSNDFNPQPVWNNVRQLFRWIDSGNRSSRPESDVWPYNGGLFAKDEIADGVVLPDHLAEEIAGLLEWDYGSDVSVNMLGHIFEHSIGDIERLREGEAPPAVSQRKREGVVYTPDHIAEFLVERTIGLALDDEFDKLRAGHFAPAELGEDDAIPGDDHPGVLPFWTDYLESLRDLTIVDPACGSGAFLVAAFDALAAEYRRVTERLADLGAEPDFDIYDEILSKNLYGVDLNVESAEIARLALWLKSARRQHRLARLDHTIRDGNSLIHEAGPTERPFDWEAAFPEIFERGGFDIVIGNPPYVRMEHLKPVKPWLARHYKVADERTDLSAYFFEKGVTLLKPGGRLGYISTSSFFRAGYGERLRLLLSETTDIESVVDFGDVQIFDGVTTYPAILTARKKAQMGAPQGDLSFLNIGDTAPTGLGRDFETMARPMPRARLTGRSWQFEGAALAALRDKIVKGRKTLGEVYGAPLYGIKTGLNEAFVIDTQTRDRLVAADPKSEELLKPFLKGENIKRWRVEPEGLWLINTPKGSVDIEDYPAIRDWLLPFKDGLEARATCQEWWELQQAQLAYQHLFEAAKIAYQDICNSNPFTIDEGKHYLANTCYFIPSNDEALLGYLNSRAAWYFWSGITNIARGGYLRLRTDFVQITPLPTLIGKLGRQIASKGRTATQGAASRNQEEVAFQHRLLTDLAAPGAKLSRKLRDFHELDFAAFRAEVKRALKAEMPVKERSQWEELHAEASAKVKQLSAEIEAAERDIDRLVYEAFELTAEEIALLEKSLAGQI